MNLQNVAVRFAVGLLMLSSSPTGAQSDALSSLIQQVIAQNRLSAPLRADITAEIDQVEGQRQERMVAIYRNPPDKTPLAQTYVEFEKSKARFLLLSETELYALADGKVKKASLDTPLDGTSWVLEDVLPFAPPRCASMRIADTTSEQMTVTCEPKKDAGSSYTLLVYKFDREKAVPVQLLLYKDTLSNLVKMMRSEDFTLVGSKWRPKRVVMQDFKLRTRDVFAIEWSQDPKFLPELFDSRSLGDSKTLLPASH
jgi:hypothetical protein